MWRNYYNQGPQNFWEGLLGGLAQGMQKKIEEKQLQEKNLKLADAMGNVTGALNHDPNFDLKQGLLGALTQQPQQQGTTPFQFDSTLYTPKAGLFDAVNTPQLTMTPSRTAQSSQMVQPQAAPIPTPQPPQNTVQPYVYKPVSSFLGEGEDADFSNLDPRTEKAGSLLLDNLRSRGIGVGISSAYRDPERNARAGGAENSNHLYGKAFDLVLGNPDDRGTVLQQLSDSGWRSLDEGDHIHIDGFSGELPDDVKQTANAQPQQPSQTQQPQKYTNPQTVQAAKLEIPNKTKITSRYMANVPAAIKQLVMAGMDVKEAINYVRGEAIRLGEEEFNNQARDIIDKQWDNLSGALQASNSNDPGAYKTAMMAVVNYNRIAKQLGQEPLDIQTMSSMIKSDEMQYDEIKVAGPDGVTVLQGVMRPKNGGYIKDKDGNMVPYITVGEPRKTGVSEEANLSAQVAMRGQDLSHSASMARIGNSGGVNSKINGITGAQYNSALGEIGRFNAWQAKNPDADGMDYPYKEKLWRAQEIKAAYESGSEQDTGGGGEPAATNEDGAAWYDTQWRDLVDNQGMTPEQATNYMTYLIQQNGG